MSDLLEGTLEQRSEHGQGETVHVADGGQVLDEEVHGGATLQRMKSEDGGK